MNDQVRSIEATGATVEEAIEAGLAQLGLTLDQVDVEVTREASRGVLGIGAREAAVRLTEIEKAAIQAPEVTTEALIEKEPEAEVEAEPVVEPKPEPEPRPRHTQEETLDLAREVVTELLERMHIEAGINAKIANPKFPGDEPSLIVDIQGKDLGFLIGRKGETLAAIQHLSRLIVNKATQQRSNLIVDVGGYKIRRERALKKLALRIADQATRRNRRIALEPMNAYERRIIHMTLRNHPTVITESVGERERRKVTILPKGQAS